MTKCKNSQNNRNETNFNGLFFMFCLWVFIMMGRPQDYIVVLGAIRPVILSTFLMILMYLINAKNIHGPDLLDSNQVKNFLMLYFIMIIGVPTSLYKGLSFKAVLTEYILTVFFVLIFYKVVNSIERLKLVLLVGCLGAGLYSFMAIRTGMGDFSRLHYGVMFDPNDLAYFVLVFLPLYFLFFGRDQNILILRLLAIMFYSSGVLVILLSGSRGGVLAFGLSLLIFLLMTKTMKRSIKFLALVSCVIFALYAPINVERYLTFLNIEVDYNVTAEGGRIDLWKIGIRAFMNNPLTGVGVGSYPIAVGLDRQSRKATTQAWQTAHNSVIQIATETGIFGLLLFVLLSFNVIKIFTNVRKHSQQIQLVKLSELGFVGFAGMFVAGFFLSQAYSIYWAFYIVFSAVVHQLYLRENVSRLESIKNA